MSFKVLHLVSLFAIAGTEQLFYNIVKHYPESAVSHVIINTAPGMEKQNKVEDLRNLGNRVTHIYNYKDIVLEAVIEKEKPDVIHLINEHLLPIIYPLYLTTGIPFVMVWHVPPLAQFQWLSKDENITVKFINQDNIPQYSVSDYATSEYKHRLNYKNFNTINNGIDLERFTFSQKLRDELRTRYAIPADALVVGSVGRIDLSWKRQNWVVEGIKHLHENGFTNVYGIIVGGGPYIKLQNLAEELHIGEYIKCTDWQEETAHYYSAFDIFAHPSLMESFGLVIAEALSCGLPATICTSYNPQNTDADGYGIIRNNYNGLITHSFDKQGFLNNLEKLVKDEELRKSFAAIARQSVEKFSVQKMAQRYHDVFTAAAAQPRALQPERAEAFKQALLAQ